MLTLLLDSTVLIDVLRRRGGRPLLIAQWLNAGYLLTTSVICIAEVMSGMRAGEERLTTEFLTTLPTYPVTLEIAQRAGVYKSERARRGVTVPLNDSLIGATALEHGLTLVTDNVDDFQLPGLLFLPLR